MNNNMLHIFLGLIFFAKIDKTNAFETAIDYEMHKKALNPEICEEQLKTLGDVTGRLFAEANANVPSNVFLRGQTKFLGHFDKCLSITEHVSETVINGKYCRVHASLPNPLPLIAVSNETLMSHKFHSERRKTFKMYAEYGCDSNIVSQPKNTITIKIDICIPATCTTEQALAWVFNKSIVFDGKDVPGVRFVENFCRVLGDKPLSTADVIAIVIFSTIILLAVLSTACEIYCWHMGGKYKLDPIYGSFSIYGNTRRLVNYGSPSVETVECADGIRALSLIWIILYHKALLSQDREKMILASFIMWNDFEYFSSSGIDAVDTFFVLSGLFLVYTTVDRFTRESFVKNLHLFYLKRLLRLWPLMAGCVLIASSFLAQIADGPSWNTIGMFVNDCRLNWWPVLLFMQNQVKLCAANTMKCLGHFWYISTDMQLYVASPLLLVWLFGPRRSAWLALALAGALSVALCTAFSFVFNFTYDGNSPDVYASLSEKILYRSEYETLYYHNPLTRSPPFVIGMFAGYLLHCYRKSNLQMKKPCLYICWILSLLIIIGNVVAKKAFQKNIQNHTLHNVMNSFSSATWGLAITWIVVACHHGYGGPVNWFLSLRIWKLPSRVSYAMYLVHSPIIFMNEALETHEDVDPHSDIFSIPLLLTQLFVVAIVLTVLIESPVQNLQRILNAPDKINNKNPKHSPNNNLETDVYAGTRL